MSDAPFDDEALEAARKLFARPVAFMLGFRVFQWREPQSLIRLLEQTGQLLLMHAILITVAWLLAARG